MKSLIISFCLIFAACSRFEGLSTPKNDKHIPTSSAQSFNTEVLLKKLFKIWSSQNSNLIEQELGKVDKKVITNDVVVYSYLAHMQTPYDQLIFETKDSKIKSINFDFLDEENEKLNDQWILAIFKNTNWKTIEIADKSHVMVPKKVLINYEDNIIAGYIDGYKNNQLRFIYFGTIDEKNLDRFKWE